MYQVMCQMASDGMTFRGLVMLLKSSKYRRLNRVREEIGWNSQP